MILVSITVTTIICFRRKISRSKSGYVVISNPDDQIRFLFIVLISQSYSKFAWTQEEYGCFFSKDSLNFGTDQKLLTVEKETQDTITLTNTSRSTKIFSLKGPQQGHKFTFSISPASVSLKKVT